jgi:FMN phosphatase YigB (HAD superfamily)
LARVGVRAEEALMIGDSDENDGAARELGCNFVLVEPLPADERPTGLIDALRGRGLAP